MFDSEHYKFKFIEINGKNILAVDIAEFEI